MDIDWHAVQDDVSRTLRDLLRYETVNPPGNETPCVSYIRDRLAAEGIGATIVESAPGRGSLIARLCGDGSERPLLLLSHIDVVPVEPTEWSHPPFAGVEAEGYIWGRGALDMKGMAAAEIEVVLLIKRLGLSLRRDVILAATADEEAGGDRGVRWLVDNHFGLLDSEYALNEGGGVGTLVADRWLFTCQTAEKGGCWTRVWAHGRPGHGSLPKGTTALGKLVSALDRLRSCQLSYHRVATVDSYVRALSRQMPQPLDRTILGVLDPVTKDRSLASIPDPDLAALLRASLHNTAVPTVLRAGTKVNVIPSVAEAEVDCRVLPGKRIEDVLDELRSVMGAEVEIELRKGWPGTETSANTPLFDIIRSVMADLEPNSIVVPYMSTGATDGRYLAARGVKVYGFFPSLNVPGEPSFSDLIHAHDERVSSDNLLLGTRALFEIVRRLCT